MKKFLLPLIIALPFLMAGCKKSAQSDVTPKPIDTLLADWDETSVPMPIECVYLFDTEGADGWEICGYDFRHVYDSQEDSALYTPIASNYHTLVVNGQKHSIEYTGEQKGKEMGSLIGGQYAYCMKGLNYKLNGGEVESSGFAFSDSFLQNHEVIALKYPENAAPRYLLDTLRTRYNLEVINSYTCAVSEDGTLAIYSAQMEPQDTACLGIRMVVDHDSITIFEDPAYYYGQGSAWHVDDGDEYYPIHPIAVTRGEKGIDIFYYEGAPESSTYAALLLRNGKFEEYTFAAYYNYIDYTPTPDPVDLPAGSELKAELDGYRVWVHTDVEQTEDDLEGKFSVYYSEPGSDNVYFVVSTNRTDNFSELWERSYPGVDDTEILAASDAYIVKYGDEYPTYRLIIEGCPDMRNTYTYTTYLPLGTIHPYFHWFRTNSGFQGMDQTGKMLMLDNYGYYDEGGRYTIRRYFDASSLDLVKEEPIEE